MFLYGMCIRSIISNKDRHWDSIVAMAVLLRHRLLLLLMVFRTLYLMQLLRLIRE